MDALAMEPQFMAHLAPLWAALPERGTFYVEPRLMGRALELGIAAEPCPRPPSIPAYPLPRLDGPPLLVASYGDIKVGRRLGYGPFALLQHGAGQSYGEQVTAISGSYSGGPDHADVTLHLVPNQHSADRWRAAYPDARIEIVGCSKLDVLPRKEVGPVTIAITFHWQTPHSLGPEAQTALGDYLPVLPELAAAFNVIGHAHPKGDWPQQMQRVYRRAGIPFVSDFEEVCRRADLLIFDNTSVGFEFAATGRPVVVLNSKHYRRNVNHGLRFWEAATVGMQVDRPEDLVATVQVALDDPPHAQAAREAALGIVYAYRSGAAQRAAHAIGDWLKVAVAA